MAKASKSKGAPKRAGGQGTGHLKASSVKAFGSSPAKSPNKRTGAKSAR